MITLINIRGNTFIDRSCLIFAFTVCCFRLIKFFGLAVVVIGTFAACWYPFIWSIPEILQVLHRLFPFARGIFEDKVANIWCVLNVIFKLKSWQASSLAPIRF